MGDGSGQVFVVDPADLPHGGRGAWTVRAVLDEVRRLLPDHVTWVLFPPEGASLDAPRVGHLIAGREPGEVAWLGSALVDEFPVIIHHYVPPGLAHPDLRHGVLLSRALLDLLCDHLAADPDARVATIEIDPGHELAVLVAAAGGPPLEHHPELVAERARPAPQLRHGRPEVHVDDLIVAVRTWSANHATRVPVVRSTWGPTAPHLIIYSDVADAERGTVEVGVPNEAGLVQKLWAILHDLDRHHGDHPWFVIVDDDTLLSVERLAAALTELDLDPAAPVIVGERYGCGHVGGGTGFDFPTLGAGAAINRAALRRLVDAGAPRPDPGAPDDLWLGRRADRLGIPLVHHPGFDQDQPGSYPAAVLAAVEPISFHRFAPLAPEVVWAEWLGGRSVRSAP